MKRDRLCAGVCVGMLFAIVCAFGGCSRAGPAAQGNLDDAVKARTEAVALQREVADTVRDQLVGESRGEQGPSSVVKALRKVIAKAESKQEEGDILLTKDHYTESAGAYNDAAKLYRQALDWRKVQKNLANAEQSVAAARLMAETSGKPDAVAAAASLQTNAEGYLEAGELDRALSEYAKAQKAFEALVPGMAEGTLEQAVAARTAMQAARDQIKDRSLSAPGVRPGQEGRSPKPGSLPDVLDRGQKAEAAANDGLEERQYGSARALFAAAEKLYQEAAALQTKREAVAAARKSVEDSMTLADKAFKGSARPASFERGKQALSDADKALGEDDLETAKPLLSQAAEQFAAARAEADKLNALTDAQQAWASALAAADEDILTKHTPGQFNAAKAKAAQAEAQASLALFQQATDELRSAAAKAATAENAARAAPVIARLEAEIARKAKFAAEDTLAELEKLIPADARMPGLRENVAAVPGPKKALTLDLSGGVKLELVLIRPGSFVMGSDKGSEDEKPAHKVAIANPFYLGKYLVTQEQWKAVLGTEPSGFKGAKLPVENVSWNDCREFTAKLNEKFPGKSFRLPTEAEWEYACRAGSATEYSFGDSPADLDAYAWYADNAGQKTRPVGEKKPNAWGLYDMHGNVWEWCQSLYKPYPYKADDGREDTSSVGSRALRGGSWFRGATACRSAFRDDGGFVPAFRDDYLGCRVLLSVQE